MEYIKILVFCLIINACAQFYTTKTNTESDNNETIIIHNSNDFLEGQFIDEDGNEVFLADLQDKPIVLMFAGVTCSTCIAETKEIIKSFKKGSAHSDVVNFITVLVDNRRVDRWRRAFGDKQPEWLHGHELSGELYFTYFPKQAEDPEFPLTPAMVIYHPFRSELFLHKGIESIREIGLVEYLKSRVGLWES